MNLPPIYFWQRIISPHMAGLALSLSGRGYNLTYVVEERMSNVRAAQGWEPPDLGLANCVIAEQKCQVHQVVNDAPANSIHICQGVRGNGLINYARMQLRVRGYAYWVIMEKVDDAGWIGLLKRLIYSYHLFRQKKHIRGILAIGEKTSQWLVRRGFSADKIYAFAYFLPVERPCLNSDSPSDRPFRFIYAGQMIPRKRVDLLLAAFYEISEKQAELILIGDGPQKLPLQSKAQELGLKSAHWLGQLSMSEVRTHLSNADCLVLPSRHDGWGAVVSEALMAGTPVICSDACGAAVAVQASSVGGVFVSGDQNDLRKLLVRCLNAGRISWDSRNRIASWAGALGNVCCFLR